MHNEKSYSEPMEIAHTPKVSIAMPVYNGELYLHEALDSLLSQTFKDFELIISDNASTDSTALICKQYAGKDRRIKYIRQLNNILCGQLQMIFGASLLFRH
jgi:cellulose synthase/poly-beta-1,6-N-acetylglucosamine synthase-like glycosyltransferase